MSKQEFWKDIRGYEGLYQVSNYGRVRSLERIIVRSNGRKQIWKERILKPCVVKDGYLQVLFSNDGKKENKRVHQLVADAFLPNPNNNTVVHHKNHNPQDNRVENLIWMSDRNHKGMHIKERCSKRVDQIHPITGEVLRQWESSMECGRNGFNQGAISRCCRNCYLKEGNNIYKGYIWKYAI